MSDDGALLGVISGQISCALWRNYCTLAVYTYRLIDSVSFVCVLVVVGIMLCNNYEDN